MQLVNPKSITFFYRSLSYWPEKLIALPLKPLQQQQHLKEKKKERSHLFIGILTRRAACDKGHPGETALRSPWSPTPGARLRSSPRHARMSVPWRRSVWITSAHSLAHAEWQTTPGGLERLGFSDSSGRLIGLRNPQTPRAGFPHGSGACRLPCEPPACRGGRKTVCVS